MVVGRPGEVWPVMASRACDITYRSIAEYQIAWVRIILREKYLEIA
jgi:hypothetical protein